VANEQDVEDILQDVFLKIYSNIDQVKNIKLKLRTLKICFEP
jgi:DNA-directed RNA polymerase specialized sigma24 family protein